MTDREKIKKYLVDKLSEVIHLHTENAIVCRKVYQEAITFVDSMDEESVSEDLEEVIDTYLATYFGGEKEKQDWPFLKKMAIHFANWQKQQLLAKAIDGHVTFEFDGFDGKTYGTIAHDPICLDDLGLKDTDKVKVIVIKVD